MLAPSSSRPKENLDFPNLAIFPSRMPLVRAFLICRLTSLGGSCTGEMETKYFFKDETVDPFTSFRCSKASNTESTVIRLFSAVPVPDDESDAMIKPSEVDKA